MAFIVAAGLLGALIGFGSPALVDAAWSAKAPAATAQAEEDLSPPNARCVLNGDEVPCSTHVKKFKNGNYGRSKGLPVNKLFANPAAAKEVFVTKITRKLKSAKPNSTIGRMVAERKCDRCLAYEMYADMVKNASCVGKGSLSPDSHLCRAKYPGEGPQLTKKQLQIGGAAVLCAGGAAITGSRGGLFAGLFGAATCGWALWTAVDPG